MNTNLTKAIRKHTGFSFPRRARLAGAVLAILGFAVPGVRGAEKLEYNRDIRPILNETCFACHGQDKLARKAKLRLDVRDEAIDRGAITPGKPDESEMIARVFSTDSQEKMPPPKSGRKLTAAQKETLRRWIAGGAEYQPH